MSVCLSICLSVCVSMHNSTLQGSKADGALQKWKGWYHYYVVIICGILAVPKLLAIHDNQSSSLLFSV